MLLAFESFRPLVSSGLLPSLEETVVDRVRDFEVEVAIRCARERLGVGGKLRLVDGKVPDAEADELVVDGGLHDRYRSRGRNPRLLLLLRVDEPT